MRDERYTLGERIFEDGISGRYFDSGRYRYRVVDVYSRERICYLGIERMVSERARRSEVLLADHLDDLETESF